MRGDGRLEHRGTQKDIECCHENIFRTNDPSNVRGEVIMSFALITAILTMAFARPASGGEIVDCVEAPGSGRWVYRIVDERRCWFPAGRLRRGEEKPLEELRWPKPIPADPLPDGFEGRWRGGAPYGWDHKE